MNTYEFFSVNEADRVTSCRSIACINDAEAREIAKSLVTPARGVEAWDVSRRVAKLAKTERPNAPER